MDKTLSERISGQILACRSAMGLSQKELARRVGVCYQQIHNYEAGKCDVSVSRLAKIGQVLNISPSLFFEGKVDIPQAALLAGSSPGRLELLQAYNKLGPSERSLLISIAKSIVEATTTVQVAGPRSLSRVAS